MADSSSPSGKKPKRFLSQKKKKPNARDLSRTPLSHEESIELLDQFSKSEPAHTVAILGASLVEHYLETLLRPRFTRHDDILWGDIIGDDGPIGTFSKKITMGYALGIYDAYIEHDLNVVRIVRNAFAHDRHVIDFNNDLIVEELRKILLPTKGNKSVKLSLALAIEAAETNGKAAYIILCCALVNEFLARSRARYRARDRRYAAKNPIRSALAELMAGQIPAGPGAFRPVPLENRSGDHMPPPPSQTQPTYPARKNARRRNRGKPKPD